MWQYSIEPKTRKNVKVYGCLSLARKYEKQLLDTGLDAVKTVSEKAVHKAGGFIENKIADAELSQTITKLWNKYLLKK